MYPNLSWGIGLLKFALLAVIELVQLFLGRLERVIIRVFLLFAAQALRDHAVYVSLRKRPHSRPRVRRVLRSRSRWPPWGVLVLVLLSAIVLPPVFYRLSDVSV